MTRTRSWCLALIASGCLLASAPAIGGDCWDWTGATRTANPGPGHEDRRDYTVMVPARSSDGRHHFSFRSWTRDQNGNEGEPRHLWGHFEAIWMSASTGDRIRWISTDGNAHRIYFPSDQPKDWPFLGKFEANGILVPAGGCSDWYRLRPGAKRAGYEHTPYPYQPDVPFGPSSGKIGRTMQAPPVVGADG